MAKRLYVFCTMAVLTVALAGISCARNLPHQAGGPGFGRQGQSFQPPKGFDDAMSKLGLMMDVSKIMVLNTDKTHALSRTQAKDVLSILLPLRSKAKLSPAEAKVVAGKLERIITPAQDRAYDKILMAEMSKMKSMMKGRGEGMGPRAGMNGPRPGARSHGTKPIAQPDAKFMRDFNPFYSGPVKGDRMAMQMRHSMDPFFDYLKNKAGGKR